MTRNNTDKLLLLIAELETLSEYFNSKEEAISATSIGWHIEHSSLVINAVTEVIKASDPKKFKRKFNFSKLFVFITGRIPKGKAKAPKPVIPKEQIDQQSLLKRLEISRKNIEVLNGLNKRLYFNHHVFGHLRKRQTIYFLELHTKHHLEIIRAIRSKTSKHTI